MKLAYYLLTIVAIIITLYVGIDKATKGFLAFSISPYIMNLYLLKKSKNHIPLLVARGMTILIISVGIYFLFNQPIMEERLEEKFSFLFMPIWQWTMLWISGFIIYLGRKKPKV